MKFPEQYRRQHQFLPATKDGDPCGFFIVDAQAIKGRILNVIATDGEGTGWQHVSVSILGQPDRSPSWAEMCFVKDLFWDAEECVMQFHPPESVYVNVHRGCLHLWKPSGQEFPTPPNILV